MDTLGCKCGATEVFSRSDLHLDSFAFSRRMDLGEFHWKQRLEAGQVKFLQQCRWEPMLRLLEWREDSGEKIL